MGLKDKATLQWDLERRLLQAEKSAQASAERWAEKIKEIRALVVPNCSHRETMEYHWTHDSGYGILSQQTGLECALCFARKPWKTMGDWIKPTGFSHES